MIFKCFKVILFFTFTFIIVATISILLFASFAENTKDIRKLYAVNSSDEILNIKVYVNSKLTYNIKLKPYTHKNIKWNLTNQTYYKFEYFTKNKSGELKCNYDEGLGPDIYCIMCIKNEEFVIETIGGNL